MSEPLRATVVCASNRAAAGVYEDKGVPGLVEWLTAHDSTSLSEVRGKMSQRMLKDPVVYERANYFKILQTWPAGDYR